MLNFFTYAAIIKQSVQYWSHIYESEL